MGETYGDDRMIDTEKYEKLLAEVKKLREQFTLAYDWVDYQFPDGGISHFAKYIGDEEE